MENRIKGSIEEMNCLLTPLHYPKLLVSLSSIIDYSKYIRIIFQT